MGTYFNNELKVNIKKKILVKKYHFLKIFFLSFDFKDVNFTKHIKTKLDYIFYFAYF